MMLENVGRHYIPITCLRIWSLRWKETDIAMDHTWDPEIFQLKLSPGKKLTCDNYYLKFRWRNNVFSLKYH